MTSHSQAEENLKIIRSLMERGTLYRAISVPSALVIGLLSLGAGFIQAKALIFNWNRSPLTSFVFLWILVFILIGSFNFYWLIVRTRGETSHFSRIKKAIICMLPSGLAGAFFTWFSYHTGMLVEMISFWMIFYGLGLLSTMVFAPRSVLFLGWSFLFSGFLSFILSESLLLYIPHIIALTFGLYHLVYAFFAWERK